MIDKIKKIVTESFDEDFDLVDLEKKFNDYDGWDSLTAMVLIDKLHEKFEIEIEADNINDMSVMKILELLNK